MEKQRPGFGLRRGRVAVSGSGGLLGVYLIILCERLAPPCIIISRLAPVHNRTRPNRWQDEPAVVLGGHRLNDLATRPLRPRALIDRPRKRRSRNCLNAVLHVRAVCAE